MRLNQCVFILVLTVSVFASADAPKPGANAGNSRSLAEVQKNIEAHVGKQVSWIARQATRESSMDKQGKNEVRYIFIAKDNSGEFFAENAFVVIGEPAQSAGEQRANKRSNDDSVRLIRGTIDRAQDVNLNGSGKSQKVRASVLVNVTVYAPGEPPKP